MHYRVVSVLAASTLLVLGVTACSSSADSDTPADEKVTLTFASLLSEDAGVKAVIAAFEEANPDITITSTSADTDNYQTTLRTQLSSGTAPDVFFTWPGDGNPMAMQVVQEAGLIEDLSSMSFATQLPSGVAAVTNVDDKTWIAPITYSGIGAVYNMTAMESAGLTVPTTWTSLLQFCADARAQGGSAFALAGATPWNTQLIPYALTPTLVYGPDPGFAAKMSEGEVTFADSEWKTAFDKNVEMADAGCFQDGFLGTTYEKALSLVSQGTAFASVQVNASIAAIVAGAPSGTTFAMEPLSATDDASATRMAGAVGASYAVNAKTDVMDAANRLIEFLVSPEGAAIYSTAASGIPAIPSSSFEADPSLSTFVTYQEDGKTDPFMDQLWPNAKVQQVHFQVIQQLLAGSISSTDALEQMDAAYAEGE